MHSPFPGMDPYLEYPAFWTSFHTRLMVAIAETIEPQLAQQYYVEVESRTYQSDEEGHELLIGIPDAVVFAERTQPPNSPAPANLNTTLDTAVATQVRPQLVTLPMPVEIKERYLEVREMGTDEVITVVELLSPKNKRGGRGRAMYEKKRRLILGSNTHLVELNLLRGAAPMPMMAGPSLKNYSILVSRSQHRPTADFYNIALQDALPDFPIPLKLGDAEPIVPLQQIFNHVYDRARYATRIDYQQPLPPPKLSAANQQWVEARLAPLRTGSG
ncbi:MAG: DUF4058 family protein [Leptolyngbyaceae cyanobacterium bins.59]|nr:DUF4058 family protein [Leptolyngbyaceae cyanobacterium bins.59]